jgi:ribonuclease P protein component
VKPGKRRVSEGFVIVTGTRSDESDENRRRLGVTVSKRVGNSVVRNRVKRCIREWFRHAREELPAGSDIVVIARRKARELSSVEVAAVLDELIRGVKVRRGGRATAEFR